MIEEGFKQSMKSIMKDTLSSAEKAQLRNARRRSVIEELTPSEVGDVQEEVLEEVKLDGN